MVDVEEATIVLTGINSTLNDIQGQDLGIDHDQGQNQDIYIEIVAVNHDRNQDQGNAVRIQGVAVKAGAGLVPDHIHAQNATHREVHVLGLNFLSRKLI